MIIENCPKCQGTHIGSYECPIFCICCANGNDLPEGEYCRACGRGNSPLPLPPTVDIESSAKIEIIYGLLWLVEVDTSTVSGMAASLARKTLLEMIDKDGQARGISIAKRAVRGKLLQAIPTMPTMNPREG
jgi:hypothetical protein